MLLKPRRRLLVSSRCSVAGVTRSQKLRPELHRLRYGWHECWHEPRRSRVTRQRRSGAAPARAARWPKFSRYARSQVGCRRSDIRNALPNEACSHCSASGESARPIISPKFDDPNSLWSVAGMIILLSIPIHGDAVTPVMRRLDQNAGRFEALETFSAGCRQSLFARSALRAPGSYLAKIRVRKRTRPREPLTCRRTSPFA